MINKFPLKLSQKRHFFSFIFFTHFFLNSINSSSFVRCHEMSSETKISQKYRRVNEWALIVLLCLAIQFYSFRFCAFCACFEVNFEHFKRRQTRDRINANDWRHWSKVFPNSVSMDMSEHSKHIHTAKTRMFLLCFWQELIKHSGVTRFSDKKKHVRICLFARRCRQQFSTAYRHSHFARYLWRRRRRWWW